MEELPDQLRSCSILSGKIASNHPPCSGDNPRLGSDRHVYPVQILDGIGAGLQGVAVPGLVARILNETGRINIGQDSVVTAQGLGAASSPAIGGWLAQAIGYPSTFLLLGALAVVSITLWCVYSTLLKKSCDNN